MMGLFSGLQCRELAHASFPTMGDLSQIALDLEVLFVRAMSKLRKFRIG
jgi:hypothetical protein